MIAGSTSPNFRGRLELPTDRPSNQSTITVAGWVFSTTSRVSTLDAVIDGGQPQGLFYGLPRPDVARREAELQAATSGFGGQIAAGPMGPNGRMRVEIFATLDDGRRECCLGRTVLAANARPSALERVDWFLRGAAFKAWLALRERRLPVSPAWWFRALMLHWREVGPAQPFVREPQAMNRDRFNDSYARWLRSHRRPGSRAPEPRPSAGGEPVSLTLVALVDRLSDLGAVVRSIRQQPGIEGTPWLVCVDEPSCCARLEAATHATSGPRIATGVADQLARADGSWLPPGHGSHVVLVGPAAIIAPGFLARLMDVLPDHDEADWIYTDDDCLDDVGTRRDPYLKGSFNLPLAAVDDYATRLAVVRRAAIERVGGLRTECGEAQTYELLLRVAMAHGRIEHLSEIGCHRIGLVPDVLSHQHHVAAERVIFGASSRAAVETVTAVTSGSLNLQTVSWKSDTTDDRSVTIVIPIRDRVDLLRPCVESIWRTVEPRRTRLLVVDDQSQEAETLAYLQLLERDQRVQCRIIKPPRMGQAFNYARLMNLAAQETETPLMLHLNNDVEAIAPGWLDQMAGWMSFPDVGVVGAKLLYPDNSIQHAGVVVSPGSGALEHFQSFLFADDPGYQWLPHRVREVSAVTGACLLTSTELFRSLGGFDEQDFPVQFNDIDFCLRVRQAGKRVVYEPSAVLYHVTSATRGREYDYNETLRFLQKYAGYRDPFVSPSLDPVSVCGPTPMLAR